MSRIWGTVQSEAKILFDLIRTISLSFLSCRIIDSNDLGCFKACYIEIFDKYKPDIDLIMINCHESLKNHLKSAYNENKENTRKTKAFIRNALYELLLKIIQKFSDAINASGLSLCIDLEKVLLGDIKKNVTIGEILSKWSKKSESFNANFLKFIDNFTNNFLAKNYSLLQTYYIERMLKKTKDCGKNITKNDTEDFMLLKFSDNKDYVLTFDDNIIDTLSLRNYSNRAFIDQLYK